MGRDFVAILGGIGLLIFAYLLFSHGGDTVSILQSLGGFGLAETKALQGR